ncbi:AraC-type DNA-binding protein [Paenibacillus sp. UNCCL117]|uniref:helix-turn-helix domain-containing protein n=1 Tax=unclassified Paenibacillus TaxID=185978 RepID=UPI00088E80C0|nr:MULTISPECIES: AraC family transcriptional regulator [unclassified Paenibacillus]SDD69849.1 AraC-type DNA-binding protein [Paenibacillus sp. cl123]SFW45221.1 AraC-type DNA-binding protein [Paenibacillus sp. UNCCL117]
MIDLDRLARTFAEGSYGVEMVYRFVIPPKSALREFTTLKHGFLFALGGEGRISANGAVYHLRPGSVFHAGPDVHLEWQATGASHFEYDLLFYSFCEPETGRGDHPCDRHFVLEPGAVPGVLEGLELLHQSIRAAGGLEKLRAKQIFLSVMHQVLSGCQHRESSSSPTKRAIEDAVSYIHGHYMDALTLDELAAMHAMSSKRFSYYFHKYTGYRPIDYAIHCRMERASEMLRTGKFPVRDIAASVGYANPLYFSRVFRKKFGMSPSAYNQTLTGERPHF